MNRFYRPFNTAGTDVEENMDTPVLPADSKFTKWLKRKTFRGFDGHSLYDVGKYFLRSLFRENMTMRASSLSFNFFLALFPTLIFLLSLLAFLPIVGLKTQLLTELGRILPQSSFEQMRFTILTLLKKQQSGLLSFGLLLAVFFASNAFHTLISTFNRRLPDKKKRNWVQNRLHAIGLTILITLLIIAGLLVLTGFFKANKYMILHKWAVQKYLSFILDILEYGVLACLITLAISCIYYFAPANVVKWRFFSAGSMLASILSILSTYGFSLYVNNFNAYNKVYGSIGAIIALMVLIYINSLVIIVGFELNTSIDKARISALRNPGPDPGD
ncbi:MAG: YihY/virulence factor BrkB family protein [Bacteroidetes bacterium]|nr:YihY/virulence factor BrkB family protein [Bacteroidota bacterium]